MSKYIYFSFFACICILYSCKAQPISKKYTDAYNLHFSTETNISMEHPWMENAAYTNCAISFFVKEPSRTLFAKKYLKGFPYGRLRTELEQRILLPIHKEEEGIVTFQGKGENLQHIFILIDGISSEEKCVFSDTVAFVPRNTLSSISRKISLTSVEMLNIRICAEGIVNKEAYIAFSKLDIRIGNKDINEYPIREFPKLLLPEDFSYIPIQFNIKNVFGKIDSMKDQKIIALGESIHGNNAIRHLAYSLMMENVENQNCKLLIWEMPMEKSLFYNRYVMDDRFILDSVESKVLDKQRMEFIRNLKHYNSDKKEEEKVRLFGMDYNSVWNSAQNSAVDIFDFITYLNRELKIPEVDQLSVLLMEKEWNNAIEYIRKYENNIRELLTTDEIESIIHILSLSHNMGKDRVERFISRDSVMFVNTSFLLDHFSSPNKTKAIIYAHNVHINPISTYPVVHCEPFGKYMKNKYANDYLPLLILIGNGSTTVYDQEFNRGNEVLALPPVESIESVLNQIDSDVYYFPLTSHFNNITLSRFQGDRKIPQEFYPYNLYQRYKGVFYIKNLHDLNSNKERINAFDEADKFLKRNKERLKLLEKIKRRINATN